MSLVSNLLYFLLSLLGIPTGLILAKLCKDEIKNWRKGFFVLSGVSLLLIILFLLTNFEYKVPVIIALFFIIMTSLTILWKLFQE